ncbi:hypothetical protein SAMN04488579_12320 [Eubacterium barkeri]|uniref:Uncharacterized protein n=2 Tax=Eubacterium barkeri TaxID=1528 RepID=A0A1H3IGY7_EUBBA|nr:hypothetical protein SAMN04488579_12320 [Eubacterium barkeri]
MYSIAKGDSIVEDGYHLIGFWNFNQIGNLTSFSIDDSRFIEYNDDWYLSLDEVFERKDSLSKEFEGSKKYISNTCKYTVDEENNVLSLITKASDTQYGEDWPIDQVYPTTDTTESTSEYKYGISKGSNSSEDTITLQFIRLYNDETMVEHTIEDDVVLVRIDDLPAFN